MEQLKKEKMKLRLDVDIQKLETEKLWEGKNKVEEDLEDLKSEYKKLHVSVKNVGLGKTSNQWRQEVQEERTKAEHWERRFREVQA
ncbi:hypothetical protein J1N35_011377 [Gossypium stocksii]|uniref:Uncharacterized protein n=1 Tax=Gossypium stocksii TaxID=47602 RepID=A0A9D4AD82_9ROSI|nr:hypothetical protein J1N35_011377 [Gossypium stocksii]